MLDRTEFLAWLSSLDPDQVVGRSRTSISCPLSTYLKEVKGIRAQIAFSGIYIHGVKCRIDPWAKWFLAAIDDKFPEHVDITAKEAIEIAEFFYQ